MSAEGSYLRMPFVTMYVDRACWAWCGVIFILQACASIWGTMKRMSCFPQTYDKNLNPGDARTLINESGLLGCFVKQEKIGAGNSSTLSDQAC